MTKDAERWDWRRSAFVAALILFGCLLLGAVMGIVWAILSPRAQLTIKEGRAAYVQLGESAVGADLTFGCLGLACGLLVGVLVAIRYKERGVELLLATAFGGLVGSLIAWKVGLAIAGAESDTGLISTAGRAEGVTFDGPLAINAPGVLGLWSLLSVLVLAIFFWRRAAAASRRMDAILLEGERFKTPAAQVD